MTQERKNEIYDKMLSWVFEHVKSDKELFRILHEEFGMTQDEFHDNSIDSLDYLFEAEKIDDTVGKISVIHLHQDEEDYHFTSEYNNTFFKTAKLYQRFRELVDEDEKVTVDTIAQIYFGAQESIEPVIFSVLTDAIEHDDRVNAVIEIDLDEEMLGIKDSSGVWKTYCLDDILYALKVVERNAGKGVNPFTERTFRELMEGNEVDIITKKIEELVAEASEEQIPAM